MHLKDELSDFHSKIEKYDVIYNQRNPFKKGEKISRKIICVYNACTWGYDDAEWFMLTIISYFRAIKYW